MIDEHVLNSALKYLDSCSEEGEQATLVEMWHFVDYYLRANLPAAVVNEALRRRPGLFVHRVEGRIAFSQIEGDREVTEDDVIKSWQIYHAEFWAKYRELENHKK
jgi:hypothetical protein